MKARPTTWPLDVDWQRPSSAELGPEPGGYLLSICNCGATYAPDEQGRLRSAQGEPLAVSLLALRGHARLASALAAQLKT